MGWVVSDEKFDEYGQAVKPAVLWILGGLVVWALVSAVLMAESPGMVWWEAALIPPLFTITAVIVAMIGVVLLVALYNATIVVVGYLLVDVGEKIRGWRDED